MLPGEDASSSAVLDITADLRGVMKVKWRKLEQDTCLRAENEASFLLAGGLIYRLHKKSRGCVQLYTLHTRAKGLIV